jgi:hypothetical protein
MAAKVPIRAVFDGTTATGLAEFQSTEFIALAYGGLGASLSIGTAGQILKVNSGASALEFGSVATLTEIDSGSTVTLDATTDIVLDAGGGDVFFKDDGTTFGSATNTSGNLIIKSGTTTAATFSGANVTFAGTFTGGGLMTTGGNIVIPDAGNIGSASDTDAISISSGGVVNFSARPTFAASLTIQNGGSIGSAGDADSITIDSSGNVTASQNLTVTGNFTVNGTTTTVATTNMVVSDNLIELNNGASSNANDSGIVIERGSTGDNAIFAWDESADKFIVGTTTSTASATGNISITTGALVANIEGSGAGLTAGTTPLTTLDIDGATDIGAAIVDADLFIIDDGAGGANRKTTAARLKTYIGDSITFDHSG